MIQKRHEKQQQEQQQQCQALFSSTGSMYELFDANPRQNLCIQTYTPEVISATGLLYREEHVFLLFLAMTLYDVIHYINSPSSES